MHNTFQSEYATRSSALLFSSSNAATGNRQRRSPEASNATTSSTRYSERGTGNNFEMCPLADASQPRAPHVAHTTDVSASVQRPSCPRIAASRRGTDDSCICTVSTNLPNHSADNPAVTRSPNLSFGRATRLSTAFLDCSTDRGTKAPAPAARTAHHVPHLHLPGSGAMLHRDLQRTESWTDVLGPRPSCPGLELPSHPMCQPLLLAPTPLRIRVAFEVLSFFATVPCCRLPHFRKVFACALQPAASGQSHL